LLLLKKIYNFDKDEARNIGGNGFWRVSGMAIAPFSDLHQLCTITKGFCLKLVGVRIVLFSGAMICHIMQRGVYTLFSSALLYINLVELESNGAKERAQSEIWQSKEILSSPSPHKYKTIVIHASVKMRAAL
jgi:hypothetical protein